MSEVHCEVIADDGDFYIELNCNYEAAEAPGFLQRRCDYGLTTPGGYECIGSFERNLAGKWRASVNAPYDDETGCDSAELGLFDKRLDAIAALWRSRLLAHCHHQPRGWQ